MGEHSFFGIVMKSLQTGATFSVDGAPRALGLPKDMSFLEEVLDEFRAVVSLAVKLKKHHSGRRA